MNPSKKALTTFVLVLLGFDIVFGVAWYLHHHFSPSAATPAPQSVMAVAAQYAQAREDGVGVDQSTLNSWVTSVKSITTPAWYQYLRTSSMTPGAGARADYEIDYNLAHARDYNVKANVSGCVVNHYIIKPTKNSELILCELSDTTILKSTGIDLPTAALPSTWTATGKQQGLILQMVKQNGAWVISSDNTNTID